MFRQARHRGDQLFRVYWLDHAHLESGSQRAGLFGSSRAPEATTNSFQKTTPSQEELLSHPLRREPDLTGAVLTSGETVPFLRYQMNVMLSLASLDWGSFFSSWLQRLETPIIERCGTSSTQVQFLSSP